MAPSSRPSEWWPNTQPVPTAAPSTPMRKEGTASPAAALPERAGRARPVIAEIRPTVDGGRYPAKGALGEAVAVEADIFADGHDELLCEVFLPWCSFSP